MDLRVSPANSITVDQRPGFPVGELSRSCFPALPTPAVRGP